MIKPAIPATDDQRVAALHGLNLLDTPNEERYDRIVREVSEKLGASMVYLALIDKDRQWLKSVVGGLVCEVGRETAFCSHTILKQEPLIIPDTHLDPRFVDHPFVIGEPHIRFYVGVPLASNGHNIGTFCIADKEPREIQPDELDTLLEYARLVEDTVNQVPNVFISYCHRDEEWKDRLQSHLSVLGRQGLINLWEDRQLGAGADWEQQIMEAIEASNVAVILISANFLTSEFIMGVEAPRLLQRREKEGLRVVPVLIKPCQWQNVPWLAKLNVRPTDAKPLSSDVDHQIDSILSGLGGEILALSTDGPGPSPQLEPTAPRRVTIPVPNVAAAPPPPQSSASADPAPVTAPSQPADVPQPESAQPAPQPAAAPSEAQPAAAPTPPAATPPRPVAVPEAQPAAPAPATPRPAMSHSVKRPSSEVSDQVTSLLVLPMEDLSPEGDQEYFCDGMAEDLITSMTKVDGIKVASRSSIFQLKNSSEDFRSLGERYGVDAVLEGSLRKAGNRLRINEQLTKVSDGFQLWAERFDRDAEDVFAVQDEISECVAQALALRLARNTETAPAEKASPPKASPPKASEDELESYELCLKGRHLWNKRTEAGLKKSLDYFQAAVEISPAYARAHAGLANSFVTLGLYGVQPAMEVMPEAQESATRAIQIDPDQPEAWAVVGCVQSLFRWSWDEGEKSFQRAIEADPENPVAHQWYAINHLVPLERFEEAEESLKRAVALDPLSPVIQSSVALLHYFAGRFDNAEAEFRKVLELEPTFVLAHEFLGQTLTELGRHDEAVAAGERAIQISGGSHEMTAMLGYSQARAGATENAQAALKELTELAQQRYVPPGLLAMVFSGLGDRDSTLARLTAAVEERSPHVGWLATRPAYAELRSDPGFQALVKTVFP